MKKQRNAFQRDDTTECDELRPLLCAFAEGEVNDEERDGIQRHLVHCAACRECLEEERRFSNLLGHVPEQAAQDSHALGAVSKALSEGNSHERSAAGVTAISSGRRNGRPDGSRDGIKRSFSRLPATAGVTVALLVLATFLVMWNAPGSSTALGSVHAGMVVGPNTQDEKTTLQSSNHIDIPAGAKQAIELRDVGQAFVLGPAVFELDRIEGSWKLTLLTGGVKLSVLKDQEFSVATRDGLEQLTSGSYVVDAESGVKQHIGIDLPQDDGAQDDADVPVDELMNGGLGVFHDLASAMDPEKRQRSMREAGNKLRRAAKHPDATADQRANALFYGAAAFANTDEYAAALDLIVAWREEHPDEFSDVAEFIAAEAYWRTGKPEVGKAIWRNLLEKSPETPYRGQVEEMLSQDPPRADANNADDGGQDTDDHSRGIDGNAKSDQGVDESAVLGATVVIPSTENAQPPIRSAPAGPYLVVAIALDEDNAEHGQFRDVANKIADFHSADIIDFDGVDFDGLRAELLRRKPINVAFVVPPETFDVNLHRRIVLMSMGMDEDEFVDFAFGYFTARDGAALAAFWDRTLRLHKQGLANKRWVDTSVISSDMKSSVIPNSFHHGWEAAAGFTGPRVWYSIAEYDPDVLEFVDQNLRLLEDASVVTMSGNGDPQGIWLFSDRMNLDHSAHWPFDPDRVGDNPDGKRVRLTADRFRALNMKHAPIIWSGTCHSGATHRVYVEPDIISTFGSSEYTELYELPADESLCLAMIDGGAGALLVPIASNHGFAVMNESLFGVANGATLGETIKSTYDDICLQVGGPPRLTFAEAGAPHAILAEHPMRGGGINRVLIGDPALALFDATAEIPGERVDATWMEGNRLQVVVERSQGFFPRDWNVFGDRGSQQARIGTRIRVPDDVRLTADDSLEVNVTVKLADGSESAHQTRAAIEEFAGATYVYIQAASTNFAELNGKARTATFDVSW